MAARRRGRRTGTFFVLLGILGVLSATFVAGFWTGHNWPVLWGRGAKAPATEPASGKRGVAERPKPSDALPALTFYDELKAPLTAPPPPPRPAKARPPDVRRETVAEPAPAPAPSTEAAARAEASALGTGRETSTPSPPRSEPSPAVAPAPVVPHLDVAHGDTSRFTVQVAAYNVRTPAEALRATLASAGHDARVVEASTSGGVRYRVQVGVFATREAAQDAATRLTAERSLATFVTTR
ncbi:MAG TPA: SPOR domain-containing protein [Methylomirabilota bacterium]|nr:SPOR domain-containing protein [Methylomirabilota bacterium]